MIIHNGLNPPSLVESWDESDRDYIWFSWENKLNGATITLSEWTTPASWTVVAEQVDASVVGSDVITYNNCNGALLETTDLTGTFVISNKVTLSDNRRFERSVKVKVKQL